MTFVKVNTEQQKDIAAAHTITSLPTFIVFRSGKLVDKVEGADPMQLQTMLQKLSQDVKNLGGEAGGSGGGGGGGTWRGADLPRGYSDITDQIELQRSELLNYDPDTGGVRVLFDPSKPSALSGGKAPAKKDWIESDTDEQLLLFVPFQSMLKLHSIQVRYEHVPRLAPRLLTLTLAHLDTAAQR